jgi:outer membrane receptor protein involved in Fe transport
MFNVKLKPVVLAVAGVLAATSVYAADAIRADKVDVISVTPLPSVGVSLKEIPSNVQTIKAKDLQDSPALDLSNYMNQNLSSVYINETQGNPIQGDLNYRGYTVSPLLGTPQGLSVYMDGVRLNQPFGDVVSWDLIPKNAIKSVQLMPGSNPLFGLNTLGGAISIQTKDGRTSQGGAIQSSFGSYGRSLSEFEYGGVSKDNSVDYFIAGTYFNERGWRDQSKSDFGQIFGKVGWQGEKTDAKLTYAYANSDLNGNGLTPKSAIDRDRSAVYTWPDNTQNKSSFVNLNLSHYFTPETMFSGNVYYRNIRSSSYNGDINDEALPQVYGSTAGQTVTNTANAYTAAAGRYTCMTTGVIASGGGEPGEKCIGMINRGSNKQQNAGLQGQLSMDGKLFDMENKFIIGGGYDWSSSHYKTTSEYGWFDKGAIGTSIIGSGYFADTTTKGVVDGELDDRSVNLKGQMETFSLFLADNLKATDKFNISASARYNHTSIKNRDQQNHYEGYGYRMSNSLRPVSSPEGVSATSIVGTGTTYYWTDASSEANGNAYRYYPGGYYPGGQGSSEIDSNASLSGDHTYHRVNPSLGFTYDYTNRLNFFGGYNEGSRAPNSIELGCANPDKGCRLPNSMAGDPYLKQVVSKTFEGGFRGNIDGLFYNVAAYNATNQDDIMFVASSTSVGYFKNFGETRRRGMEFGLAKEIGNFTVSGNFSFVDATYQSPETVGGSANSSGTNTNNAYYYDCLNTDATRAECIARVDGANATSNVLVEGVVKKGGAGSNNTSGAGETIRTIQISKGDRIPLIPRQLLKLSVNYRIDDKSSIGLDSISVSDVYVRGNENNKASGGSISGYTVFNLSASYKPNPEWTIFARVNNLLDKDYETGGQLGLSPFSQSNGSLLLSGTSSQAVGETFVAPGAPRTAWVGARYEFGGPAKK